MLAKASGDAETVTSGGFVESVDAGDYWNEDELPQMDELGDIIAGSIKEYSELGLG